MTGRPPSGAAALALVATLALPLGARGQRPPPGAGAALATDLAADGDYGPDNGGWNGLRDLFALARGLGMRPELRGEVAWEELGDDTVLFVVYPRARLEVDKFIGYVQGGGRLLLADDYGTGDALLERLGLTRHHGTAPAARFYRDNPSLPVALAQADHDLTRDVKEVVTNHPAWLRGALTPILGFSETDIVCAAGAIGDGTVVLLSDPSVLINNMLELSGNLAFAANLLRYLARPGDRIVVVTGDFGQRGAPLRGWPLAGDEGAGSTATRARRARAGGTPPAGPAAAFLREFNQFLGGLGDWVPTEAALRALLVAAAGAALFALLLLAGRHTEPSAAWAHGGPPPRSAFDEAVRRYGTGRSPVGGGMLASLLRDEVEARLARDLGLDPVSALDPARCVPRLRAVAGPPAAALAQRLLPRLAKIPPSERAFGKYPPLSRRRLARLHGEVEALFAALESGAAAPGAPDVEPR